MRKKDVPQDLGLNEGLNEVTYAVDESGRYVLVPSKGWEPKIVTNAQAWELISEQVANAVKQIRAGKASPIAYYMAKNQMDIGLLAKYVRLFRWSVWRHLKPEVFKGLKPDILERYASVFNISVQQLSDVSAILNSELSKEQNA